MGTSGIGGGHFNEFLFNAGPSSPIGPPITRYIDVTQFVSYLRRYLLDAGRIWSDQGIQRIVNQAGVDIGNDLKCIWGRFSLGILSGLGTYQLPTIYQNVTAVTYRNWPLEAVTPSELHLLSPSYRTQISRPRWYMISQEGYNVIRFFPVPNENLLQDDSQVYLDTGASAQCIVSAYLNVSDGDLLVAIPDYIYQRLMRYFVLAKLFKMEGDGQNLGNSAYFNQRYTAQLEISRTILRKILNSKERQYTAVAMQKPWRKPRPVLPPNFGSSVR